MAKKDQLASLIESLTPAEKKYFKQQSALRSDDKSYMRLFNCVLRDSEFNTAKLSRELNKTPANLAHEKAYLAENILKALRNYHDNLPDIEMYNLAADVAILKHKGLYQMAEQRNKTALKAAQAHARFDMEWDLLERSMFLKYKLLPLAQNQRQRIDGANQMKQKLEDMDTATQFAVLGIEIEKQFLLSPTVVLPDEIKRVNKILNQPLLKKHYRHPAFSLQQHLLLNILYSQLKRFDKVVVHARNALKLIETEPLRSRSDELAYAVVVNGYLVALNHNRQFDEFLSFLKKLKSRYYRKLPFNQTYLDGRFDAYYFLHMVQYFLGHRYLFEANRGEVKKLLLEFEQQSQRLKLELNSALWLHLQKSIIYLYFFCMHDDEKALDWVNRSMNDKDSRVVNQVLSLIKMTSVLIHFQRGNYSILPGLMRSTVRHLKKFGKWTVVEQETLAFIAAFIKLNTATEERAAFRALKVKYDALKKSLPEEQTTFARIFYDIWVERNLS